MTDQPLLTDRLLEEAKPLLQIERSERVLVVGCGEGSVCRWLARQAEEGIVIGLDASDARVRAARAASISQDNIMYLWTSAEQIPWQENFFTLALSIPALAAIENTEKAYREIGRVLEPGGRLWVMESGGEIDNQSEEKPNQDLATPLERLGFAEIRSHDAPGSLYRFVFARKPAPPRAGSPDA